MSWLQKFFNNPIVKHSAAALLLGSIGGIVLLALFGYSNREIFQALPLAVLEGILEILLVVVILWLPIEIIERIRIKRLFKEKKKRG